MNYKFSKNINKSRINFLFNFILDKRNNFYILTLLALIPIYILLRSIFIDFESMNKLTYNQFILGSYWNELIQQIGFISLVIFFLRFFLNKINHPNKKIFSNPFTNMLLLMLIWSIFSCLFSDNISRTFFGTSYRKEGLLAYFVYTGIFISGYNINKNKYRKIILKAFVLTSLILSILMLLDIEYLNELFTLRKNATIFYNINHFAYYLCMAIMASVVLIIKDSSKYYSKLFYLLSFSILVIALIQNRSFGPYLAVIAGIVFVTILVFLYSPKSKKSITLVLISFILISSYMNLETGFLTGEANKLSTGVNDIIQKNETAEKAGSNRWEFWKYGVQFALEKPLFGYGPDNLGEKYLEVGITNDRPHNEIIQFAASLGIPAALFYILAMAIHFWNLFKNRKKLNSLIIGFYGIIFTYLVSSMFGNTMYYTSPFFFMFLGISGNLLNNSDNI